MPNGNGVKFRYRRVMYKIESKKRLNAAVTEMEIIAPDVAEKAAAGQFIILRVDESGERIPLTVAGFSRGKGTVKIIFQTVGATTKKLSEKNAGEYIADFVGPLGNPAKLDGLKNVCVVGGGVGTAIALPIAEELKRRGAKVTAIAGFKNKDIVILENEFKSCSDNFIVTTDDGSYGLKGNVCVPLASLINGGEKFDEVIAIGPVIMMKFVTETVKPTGMPVTVSMNPLMIDGTGMCGCCRLTLIRDGKREVSFACVEGPDYNGYEVDFDEAATRLNQYGEFERAAYEKTCNLFNASLANKG